MPTDDEVILAYYIFRTLSNGLRKATPKEITSRLKTKFGRFESSFQVFDICRNLAKENLLDEIKTTSPDGKIEYRYSLNIHGHSIMDTLSRDILRKKQSRL